MITRVSGGRASGGGTGSPHSPSPSPGLSSIGTCSQGNVLFVMGQLMD